MLTPQSYGLALLIYVLAALVASVFVYRHWLRHAGPLARRAVIGAMLGILIAPALPGRTSRLNSSPESTGLTPRDFSTNRPTRTASSASRFP